MLSKLSGRGQDKARHGEGKYIARLEHNIVYHMMIIENTFMYDVLRSVPPAVLKNVKSKKFAVYVIILLCIIFGTVQI